MRDHLAALLPVWLLGVPLLIALYELAIMRKELARPEPAAPVHVQPTRPTAPGL
jgi:hypothetical protein